MGTGAGCKVFKDHNLKHGTSELRLNDDAEVERVRPLPIQICLECPLKECSYKKNDDRRLARGEQDES